MRCAPPTSAAPSLATARRTSPPTCAWPSDSVRWPAPAARRRPSWRSPGCCTRATTSSPRRLHAGCWSGGEPGGGRSLPQLHAARRVGGHVARGRRGALRRRRRAHRRTL